MPRTWPRYDHLTGILKRSLGVQGAKQELQWMKQSLQEQKAFPKETCSPHDDHELLRMVKLRAKGTPLAYVIGDQPFGPLSLKTRAPTLIPRPETEHWTTRLSEVVQPSKELPVSILDLCTGTGCIPLLLSHLWPPGSLHSLAVDISQDAVVLAQENIAKYGLSSDEGTCLGPSKSYVRVAQQDISDPSFRSFLLENRIGGKPFGVLTCNPPYIPRLEYDRLSPSVRDFEDRRALLGEENGDGLSFYRMLAKIIAEDANSVDRVIAPGAIIALEHGEGQSASVRMIMETGTRGLVNHSEAWLDQWDKERVVLLRIG